MRSIHEDELDLRVARDEGQGLGRELDVQRYRDGPGAHRAVERLDVLRAIQRENADAVAAGNSPGHQPSRNRVAVAVQLGVGDLAGGGWAGEVNYRYSVVLRTPLTLPSPRKGEGRVRGGPPHERPDIDPHGTTMILPKTSRSSRTRIASRDSAKGYTP